MSHPHLDVLFEDQFSRFVADGLDPSVVVNAYRDRINLGLRSADETVDVFLGGLSAEEARTLGTALLDSADAVEHGRCDDSGQTWSVFEVAETDGNDGMEGTEESDEGVETEGATESD